MDIAVENYAYIEVCVTGKHICEENKRLRRLKEDRVYMLNLVSATQFYELTDMLKGKKCYREPCIYDWCEDNPIFDETMNDFLQDNLSELWEDCRPDRLKECIGRLYEKISSIRYFKGVKKRKADNDEAAMNYKTVGLIGLCSGAGTTQLGIMLANYFLTDCI